MCCAWHLFMCMLFLFLWTPVFVSEHDFLLCFSSPHSPLPLPCSLQVRCVRPDQSGANNVVHYLSTGEVVMSVNVARQPFFLPVMLLFKVFFSLTLSFEPGGAGRERLQCWCARRPSSRPRTARSSSTFCRETQKTRASLVPSSCASFSSLRNCDLSQFCL